MIDPAAAVAHQPNLPTATVAAPRDPAAVPPVATAAAAAEEQRRRGFFPTVGRILGIGGGGGSIFGIGPNGFSQQCRFLHPVHGAGGRRHIPVQPAARRGRWARPPGATAPSPATRNMQGTMWNRSGDNGSVGYVTDPFNRGHR